jgi:hypothetical protein
MTRRDRFERGKFSMAPSANDAQSARSGMDELEVLFSKTQGARESLSIHHVFGTAERKWLDAKPWSAGVPPCAARMIRRRPGGCS